MKYVAGLHLEPIAPEDFVLGGERNLDKEILQPNGDWSKGLVRGELQRQGGLETFGCVPFTTLTICEMLIKRKYGLTRNYSDRFLVVSSETKGGNTPKKVGNSLRKMGCAYEEYYPWVSNYDKYFQELSPAMLKLAKEFNDEWEVGYEVVPDNPESIREALQYSPLGVAVFAWAERNGVYYKPQGASDTHFTTLYKKDEEGVGYVLDSYEPFHKKIEKGTPHSIIYRYHIEKRVQKKKTGLWAWIISLFT